jgi:hypothetical protein
MGMDEPAAVERYKQEQVDTGLFSIPFCRDLKALSIERPMPFNVKNILILSSMVLIIVIAIYWALVLAPR